jgi:hypothetical protein
LLEIMLKYKRFRIARPRVPSYTLNVPSVLPVYVRVRHALAYSLVVLRQTPCRANADGKHTQQPEEGN